uniref:MAP3K7 C-terminal-like protein n=1 Tax=Castor canadensis TaxID=51338 RepID=A0A8B7USF9_CASCN|nr:MAP3K7 C-terminal-like protein [Castor canadensis]
MISTASVPADKPVRIAFSLNDASDDTPPEDSIPLVFPELDQHLQNSCWTEKTLCIEANSLMSFLGWGKCPLSKLSSKGSRSC